MRRVREADGVEARFEPISEVIEAFGRPGLGDADQLEADPAGLVPDGVLNGLSTRGGA